MRTVSVTGHGEARVVPDSAVVRVAAAHRAAGVADALDGTDSAARQIVATAREHTTPERIGSTSLQVWPAHGPLGEPAGFEARHSVTIGCSDVRTAGRLLSALADAVGERLHIESVSLEVSDRSAAEQAARQVAYRDAVERGRHLAELAGARLGDPQSVVESAYGDAPIGRPVAAAARLAAVALEPGEMSVTASVTVTFELVGDGGV